MKAATHSAAIDAYQRFQNDTPKEQERLEADLRAKQEAFDEWIRPQAEFHAAQAALTQFHHRSANDLNRTTRRGARRG